MTTEHHIGPSISRDEFRKRFERAQQMVRERKLDALLVNSHEADFANVRYFSDYWPIFEIAGVVIPANGEGALLIGPESETFARDRSTLPKIFKLLEYRESADPAYPGVPVSSFADVFKQLGIGEPARIGIGGYLVTTAPVLDGLRKNFPKATIERADEIMVALRSVKSEEEIACLRRAFEITEQATMEVLAHIKPGMTELQVCGISQSAIYRLGAEYEGLPPYVLSGTNSRHAISRPTHKKLEKGDMVQLNLSARVSGYSASVGVPVCLGKMDSRQRELVEFGLEAHNQTIQKVRSGLIAADIAKWYRGFFVERGYAKTYLYGPCHGIGMIEVEPPWMEETSQYPLRDNMTFQVDTFLCDERFGLRWENGGRVTAGGFELFSGQLRKIHEIE
jgi:Xaa-Pro aminopeptidase